MTILKGLKIKILSPFLFSLLFSAHPISIDGLFVSKPSLLSPDASAPSVSFPFTVIVEVPASEPCKPIKDKDLVIESKLPDNSRDWEPKPVSDKFALVKPAVKSSGLVGFNNVTTLPSDTM